MLNLLGLAPAALRALLALDDPLPHRVVTARQLRPLLGLPSDEQRQRVARILDAASRVLQQAGRRIGGSMMD